MHWRVITGGGLPRLTGRTSVAVATHSNAERVYLIAMMTGRGKAALEVRKLSMRLPACG